MSVVAAVDWDGRTQWGLIVLSADFYLINTSRLFRPTVQMESLPVELLAGKIGLFYRYHVDRRTIVAGGYSLNVDPIYN